MPTQQEPEDSLSCSQQPATHTTLGKSQPSRSLSIRILLVLSFQQVKWALPVSVNRPNWLPHAWYLSHQHNYVCGVWLCVKNVQTRPRCTRWRVGRKVKAMKIGTSGAGAYKWVTKTWILDGSCLPSPHDSPKRRAVRSVTARKGRGPVGSTVSHSGGQRFKS